MNLIKLSWRNITNRPLNTTLSLVLLCFGVGIISLLLLMQLQLEDKYKRNIKDIDLVIGAKGSALQIILSAVYHVDAPTGNIKLSDVDKVKKNRFVKSTIPLAYGDNFGGFHIVGTEHSYPAHYGAQVAEGRLWQDTFEATIGSKVAKAEGLRVGDTFYSAHGLEDATDVHKEFAFTVVGIFEENNSVVDQLVLTPIQSIWDVHPTPEGAPEKPKELTALLVQVNNKMGVLTMTKTLENTNMQVALPSIEVNRLTQNFGIGMQTLNYLAGIIILISMVSVFISLYNSLKERKYELAIMRTMGASRGKLFGLVLLEGILLCLVGCVLGLGLSRLVLWILSGVLDGGFEFALTDIGVLSDEWVLCLSTIFVGIVASFLPSLMAIRIDISKTLSDG